MVQTSDVNLARVKLDWQAELNQVIAMVDAMTFAAEDQAVFARKIFPCIDLTSLNDSDTNDSIIQFSQKAMLGSHQVAALCVYAQFLPTLFHLRERGIRLATVANFPSGNRASEVVCAEILSACSNGADEIDVVFPYQDFLSGQADQVRNFLLDCRQAAGATVLKVILETGMFARIQDIFDAAVLCYEIGADFTKTSTGKISQGASLLSAGALWCAARHCQSFFSRPLGVKVSGGVRTLDQAIAYFVLARELMGENAVSPWRFRLGASQLVDSIIPYLL